MFTKIFLLLGILAVSGTTVVFADTTPIEDPSDPSTYFLAEVIGGSAGALAGGWVGGAVGATFFCPKSGCAGFQDLANALLGYLAGNAIGGIIGTIVVGSLNRVKGNILLALVGAVVGDAVGFLLTATVVNLFGSNFSAPSMLILMPVLSGLGATLGYNIGATIETPRTTGQH